MSESAEQAKEQISPWKLGGLTAWQLCKVVWHGVDHDEVFTRSAALSYYFFCSLIPMVFFLMATLGIFASQSQHLRSTLLNYFSQVVPPMAFGLIEKTLEEISKNSSGLKLLFGLAFSLYAGSSGMISIMDALNRCYRISDARPYWKRIVIAVGLTTGISAFTVCALVIVLSGGYIAQFVGKHIGLSSLTMFVWGILQWPVALFVVLWSFALIYFWGPDARQHWQWITPGSLVGVVLWVGASVLFRLYLHFYNSYSKTYGSLGAVIVLLLWLYFTGLAILVGGEINSGIEAAAAKRGRPDPRKLATPSSDLVS